MSLTPQVSRETSEEAVINHHHMSALGSSTPPITRGTSEEAVVAHHHLSVSRSLTPRVSRTVSEEAVLAYHHMSTSTSSSGFQVDQDVISDQSVFSHYQLFPSLPSPPTTPPSTISLDSKTRTLGSTVSKATSLLHAFAYPSSNPLGTGVTLSDSFTPLTTPVTVPAIRHVTQDGPMTNILPAHQEETVNEPTTPPSVAHALLPAVQPVSPPTPSRLGPTWKTETAPASVADETEIDELESELDSDEDEDDTPSPSPIPPRHVLRPSPQQPDLNNLSLELQSSEPETMEIELDLNGWAFERGIDPKQWDNILARSPTQSQEDPDTFDEQYENADESDEDEKSEEDEVEGECGYRVFAGWSNLDSLNRAQLDYRDIASSQMSTSSFGSLTPKRPTALEATIGDAAERIWSKNTSLRSSAGRVSAEIESPLPITPVAKGRLSSSGHLSSPSYLVNHKHHNQDLGTYQTPSTNSGLRKRDQVILALLQAGHVALAEDVLRGDNLIADTH
jgi:hypothetical protein